MDCTMDFEAVVLAGGISKRFFPLVSKKLPKAMLPVGNRPLLSYVLNLLEENNLKRITIFVEGEDAKSAVVSWMEGTYDGRAWIKVQASEEDSGTADVLRKHANDFTAKHILVVSGDLVCDVPLGAVAATHSRLNASMTALLCPRLSAGVSDGSSGVGGKDKLKQQISDIVGLDPTQQFLTFMASASQAEKELRVQRSIVRAFGKIELHTDLMDGHLYIFKSSVLREVLHQRAGIHSIKEELVPYLIRTQLRCGLATTGDAQIEDSAESVWKQDDRTLNYLFNEQLSKGLSLPGRGGVNQLSCCAYVAKNDKYCARVNSIQAFNDANHDIAGERAIHLTSYEVSKHNNVVHPTAQFGYKSTVGPHCMLGEGSQMGDKSSIKRSVVGRHCRIGSGVKIMSSVVMDYVTMEDGCHIQGSVICRNAKLQEHVILKDCQVGEGYQVPRGEYQSEALTKRDKM